MVEDTIRHYSMLLPIMYTELVEQTRRSLSEDLNEMQRLIRRRARPKILLAQTYEEALDLHLKFKDYTLGVITDVEFKRGGKLDTQAGFKLAKQIRNDLKFLPILVQSSKPENKSKSCYQ